MADSNILKEYLMKLGWQLDEASQKRFDAAVDRTTKSVVSLSSAAVAAAATVVTAISQIAQTYEDLYYVAQRNDQTVKFIRGVEYAGRTIGLTYEQSRASIESFGASMRMNPGLSGFLSGMGVDPKAEDAQIKMVRRLKETQQYFVAARMAGMFGIPEQTFRHMWQNLDQMEKSQADWNKRLKESGVDMDRFAQTTTKYTTAQNELLNSLHLILLQTGEKWLPTMTTVLSTLDQYAREAVRAGKATEGWTSTLLSLAGAAGALKTVSWVLRLLGFGGLAATTGFGATALGVGAGGAGLAWWLKEKGINLNEGLTRSSGASGGKSLGGGTDPKNKQAAIAYFMGQGWSREQAIGMASSLIGESNLNPAAYNPAGGGRGAHGIGQWRGSRLDDFKRLFGKDLKGSTLEEQLAFSQWELTNTEQGAGAAIKGAKTARQAAELHSRLYERHGVPGEDARRGARAEAMFAGDLGRGGAAGAQVNISQKTDIHLQGGSDPAQAASQVVQAQDRVNGDIVRNTKSAIQ